LWSRKPVCPGGEYPGLGYEAKERIRDRGHLLGGRRHLLAAGSLPCGTGNWIPMGATVGSAKTAHTPFRGKKVAWGESRSAEKSRLFH